MAHYTIACYLISLIEDEVIDKILCLLCQKSLFYVEGEGRAWPAWVTWSTWLEGSGWFPGGSGAATEYQ